ncbi:MAG: hypothetical protein ACLGHG_08110 [Gammaproteobacteria bacterium]
MSSNIPLGPLRPPSFRWKAFGIHLAISLAILCVLLYVLFMHWFPGYLFDTDGGWQALQIISGVDLILGPALTLVAASPAKSTKELRKDFTVIGTIQVAALCAGMWLAWANHPAALIWLDGEMYSQPLSAFREHPDALKKIHSMPAAASGGPPQIRVALPDNLDARSEIFRTSVRNASSIMFEADRYRPFSTNHPAVRAASARYHERLTENRHGILPQDMQGTVDEFIRQGYLIMPMNTRYGNWNLAMLPTDPAQARLIDFPPVSGIHSPRVRARSENPGKEKP